MQSRISLARLHIHLVLTFKKYELLDMLISFFRRVLRACVVLFPLLGVTWVFGVLSVTGPTGIVFQYLFTICNSLQVIFGFWPWLNLYWGCVNYKFRVKRCRICMLTLKKIAYSQFSMLSFPYKPYKCQELGWFLCFKPVNLT